jgi:uncharacterized membrane protein
MKRLPELLVVLGAMILTGGGGYIIVLGHVARANRDPGFLAVGIAVIGTAILTIGLLILSERK